MGHGRDGGLSADVEEMSDDRVAVGHGAEKWVMWLSKEFRSVEGELGPQNSYTPPSPRHPDQTRFAAVFIMTNRKTLLKCTVRMSRVRLTSPHHQFSLESHGTDGPRTWF